MLLWVLLGVILVAVVWALVAGSSSKARTDVHQAYVPPPVMEPEKPTFKSTSSWEEGVKTSVSSKFGKGGAPTGVSHDSGGVATSSDEDMDWLKKATPFEPRLTRPLDNDEDMTEAGEPA